MALSKRWPVHGGLGALARVGRCTGGGLASVGGGGACARAASRVEQYIRMIYKVSRMDGVLVHFYKGQV